MKMGPITAVQPEQSGRQSGPQGRRRHHRRRRPAARRREDRSPIGSPTRCSERMRQAARRRRERDAHRRARFASRSKSPSRRASRPSTIRSCRPAAPVGVPALGIAYRIDNEVVAVIADSPAAAAKIEPGDKIAVGRIRLPERSSSRSCSSEPLDAAALGKKNRAGRRCSISCSNSPAGTTLELTIERGDEKLTKKLTPVAAEGLFVADRGFLFNPIERIRRATSFSEQIQYGWDETTDALGMVFRFLKKIGTPGAGDGARRPDHDRQGGRLLGLRRLAGAVDLPDDAQREPGGAELPADSAVGRRTHGVPGLRRRPRPAGERDDSSSRCTPSASCSSSA